MGFIKKPSPAFNQNFRKTFISPGERGELNTVFQVMQPKAG
jgi:hypothetical protein